MKVMLTHHRKLGILIKQLHFFATERVEYNMVFTITVVANSSENVCEESSEGKLIQKRYADEIETKVTCAIFYHATAKHTHGIAVEILSVRLSVCLSACLSVSRVYCDKTKAPNEKSSIMTNRKSSTSFPMSLR